MLKALILLGLGAGWVQAEAPDMRIVARPLTPQEISDYNMTNTTQLASGGHVVGLGQPVYLEFLVQKGVNGGRHPIDFVTVTNVIWSLDSAKNADGEDLATSAEILESVLPADMPTYDGGFQQQYDVIDRTMIIPDLRGTYSISVEATSVSNGVYNVAYSVVGSTFLGKDYTACTLCHESKQANFNATGHATALEATINDPDGHFQAFCIACHSVGYDTTPAAYNSGFDDVAADLGWTFPEMLGTNNWDEMPEALQMKSNVQCENCHGPAQEHMRAGGDTSKIAVNLSAGNCSQCHDKQSHHVKSTEWKTTAHANGYVFRGGSCGPCHSTAGYINANDPGMNEYGDEVEITGSDMEGVTCAACHDPHSPGAGAHQLRSIESVELANGFLIEQGGDGLVCMACHKDRYEANDRASQGNTPHHGTQSDLLFGQNAIEYGQNLPSSRHWDVVEDTCAQCHMQETPSSVPDYAKNNVGGHTFMLSYNDGTNDTVYLTETCVSCHGEIENFNFGGADYDLDGVVEGVQKEVSDMMAELAMMLESAASGDSYNKANYNLAMIEDDGSLGVHNPKYIAALLRSSIDDLKGGIDIDCDGLVDSWEMMHFGDLTSQSGADDWDSDGLSNLEEMNVGTDPKLVDTDGDTFWDLAELQGGSDPLDIDSVLTDDLVMLPAAELAYLPKGTGTVVRFQSMDSLTGGTWTNIGPEQVSGGNWVFQLENTRTNGMNRFFRATED